MVAYQGAAVEEWVNNILLVYADKPTIMVGLDVQIGRTDFIGIQIYILTLCIDDKCLIVQRYHMGKLIPQSLKSFLMNPRFSFVGVDGDFAKLVSVAGLDCAKSVDIGTAVINKWPKKFPQHDLDYLAEKIAGLSLTKPHLIDLKSWRVNVLDEKQVLYACIFAYASYKIGLNLILEN